MKLIKIHYLSIQLVFNSIIIEAYNLLTNVYIFNGAVPKSVLEQYTTKNVNLMAHKCIFRRLY